MRKVLIGLVIALMMTGSGYTKEMGFENCDLLRTLAIMNVDNARQRFLRIGSDIALGEMKMTDKDAIDTAHSEINEYIKKAHYSAVTFSALCD